MENYKNKKVLIWGLGLNGGGLGMAKYFAQKGSLVTVTDLKTKRELAKSIRQLSKYKNIKYVLGEHREKDFIESDVIVQNPAIPPTNPLLKLAQDSNKEIINELLFVIQNFPGKIIGVTGTKGKSTTATLIKHLIGSDNTFLGGNLQTSTIEILEKAKKNSIAVLEIPSFQLEFLDTIKKSPNIAIITNIGMDHINWHGDLTKYQTAKKNIFKYQTKKDYLIINNEDKVSKTIKKINPNLIKVGPTNSDYIIDKDKNLLHNGKIVVSLKNYVFKGEGQLINAGQAVATAKIIGLENSIIQKRLGTYKGLSGRQEVVAKINGVTFVNDTAATAPIAIKTCIENFKQNYKGKIILISGGMDKNLELPNLKADIENNVKALIVFEGTGSEKLLEKVGNIKTPIYKYYNSMEKAVEKAVSIAKSGDAVILSPGFASFNMFINEFDRGEKFNYEVRKLKNDKQK